MDTKSSKQSSQSSSRWRRREFLARITSGLGVALIGVPAWMAGTCEGEQGKYLKESVGQEGTGSQREALPKQEPGLEPQVRDASAREVVLREPTPEAPTKQEPVMEPRRCSMTEDNIEGPYYRENAPWKTRLTDSNEPGVPLRIEGIVMDQSCQPIPNAVVDVWQANDKGSYDNDGNNDPPNKAFHLRGRMRTNAQGQYAYDTIVPGRYLNGDTFRPSHIHYKVYASGYQTLTTQLYFEGDPYIKGDSFVRPSLIIKLKDKNPGKAGEFSIVLQRKG